MEQIILTSINKDELVQIFTVLVEDAFKKHNNPEQKKEVPKNLLNPYLTKKETAELCRVASMTTLWNWEQKGKLVPKRKSGKTPLYLRDDVEAFLLGNNQGVNFKEA